MNNKHKNGIITMTFYIYWKIFYMGVIHMEQNSMLTSQNLSKLSVLENFTNEDLYKTLRFHFEEEKISSLLKRSEEQTSDKKYNDIVNKIVSKSARHRLKMNEVLSELIHFTSHRHRVILPINFTNLENNQEISETLKDKILESPEYKQTIFDFNASDSAILFIEQDNKILILKKIDIIPIGDPVGGAIPKKTIFFSAVIDIKNHIFEYAYDRKDIQDLNNYKKSRQEAQIEIDSYANKFLNDYFAEVIDNRVESEAGLLKSLKLPQFIFNMFNSDYEEKSIFFKRHPKSEASVDQKVDEVMGTLDIDAKLTNDARARIENLVLWDIAFLLSSRIRTNYVFGFSYNDGNITKSHNRHKSRKPIYESSIYWDLMESVKKTNAVDSLTLRHQSSVAHVDYTIAHSLTGLEVHLLKIEQEQKTPLRVAARKELLNDIRIAFREHIL